MYKGPKISIIIPAKNEVENIGACLDSIFSLDFPPEGYEVIVVDNGSYDNTTQIAIDKGASVFSWPNVNISTLRNYGVSRAKGEIIAFLDADCTVELDWLKSAEKHFGDESIVCFGSAPKIPPKPTWVQTSWFQVRKKREPLRSVSWLESMNMFVRKDVFQRVGGFNLNLITCEDVDLSYRLSKFGRIISDQSIQAIHHGEAKGISEFFRKECWRGQSSYQGLHEHGIQLNEIPSLILPPFYLVMAMLTVILLLTSAWHFTAVAFLLWQLPVIGLTLIKIQQHSTYKYYFQLLFLYNIYYFARGIAVLK